MTHSTELVINRITILRLVYVNYFKYVLNSYTDLRINNYFKVWIYPVAFLGNYPSKFPTSFDCAYKYCGLKLSDMMLITVLYQGYDDLRVVAAVHKSARLDIAKSTFVASNAILYMQGLQ